MLVFKRFKFGLYLILCGLFIGFLAVIFQISTRPVVAATTVVLQPINGKDAFVVDQDGGEDTRDTNYGSANKLWFGNGAMPTFHDYIQFDLSSIPSGATIDSASLSIYFESVNGVVVTVSKRRVTESWDEATITWNNQPAYGSSQGNWEITDLGWNTTDVTEIISQSLTTNYGIALIWENNPSGIPDSATSSEGADNQPKLTIVYSGGTTTPPETPPVTGDTHKACVNNTCQTIEGAGTNTCTTNTQCQAILPPSVVTPTHKACVNNTCQTIEGAGADECQDDSFCLAAQPAITEEEAESVLESTPQSYPSVNIRTNKWMQVIDRLNQKSIPVIPLAVGGALSVASVAATFWAFASAELSAKEYLLAILNYLISLFSLKKRSKQGEVFDASTGKPVSGAVVNLFTFPEMKLISSAVSDMKGRFYFVAQGGKYALSCTGRGFTFPSHLAKKQLAYSNDLYMGQTIELDDAKVINYRIPVDPSSSAISHQPNLLKALLLSNILRVVIMMIGTIISMVILYFRPITINFLILASYALLWGLEYMIESRIVKLSTVIEKATGDPVDLALVRVVDENGRLKQTYVTDYKGRVMIKTENATDGVRVERVGYKKLEIHFPQPGFIEDKRLEIEKL